MFFQKQVDSNGRYSLESLNLTANSDASAGCSLRGRTTKEADCVEASRAIMARPQTGYRRLPQQFLSREIQRDCSEGAVHCQMTLQLSAH